MIGLGSGKRVAASAVRLLSCLVRDAGIALACMTPLLALLAVGCEEEKKCAACPESPIQLETIYADDDSVAIGATVRFWALPQISTQQYSWTASAGRFLEIDGSFARWKAPDTPAIVKITAVAFDENEESRALSVPIAVETYLPREEPTYAGAAYCGLECHGVDGHGSSHVSWSATPHAQAFSGLEQDPLYHAPCALCHTVGYGDHNSQGWVRYNGGYDEIPIAKLAGVQCENCHGPLSDRYGEILSDHGARALGDSLLAVGTPAAPIGCGACHENYAIASCSSGQCHADGAPAKPYGKSYVSEWARGAHDRIPVDVDLQNPECLGCHTAQGFIARVATGAPPAVPPAEPLPITCAACHDPHGSPLVAGLREGPENDLCADCHSDADRPYPDAPHSPQTQMLTGEGGYEYAGVAYGSSPHEPLVRNADLPHHGCVHCHYRETGSADSHSFKPDPTICRTCHPGANGVNFDWTPRRAEIVALTRDLYVELSDASAADSLTEAFAQANHNLRFVFADGSNGAHNYVYTRQLLESSLENFPPARP